jgi:hypothetical protein
MDARSAFPNSKAALFWLPTNVVLGRADEE